MATQSEVNKFLQSGAKSFNFERVGDSVTGEIVDMDLRQQTSMDDGSLLTWANGDPRMMLVITLQTTLQDDESDDGTRTVWCRGGNYKVATGTGSSSLTAIRDALRKTKAVDLEIGGALTMTHSGLGDKSNKAFSAPKLYTCEYTPPVRKVSVDELT